MTSPALRRLISAQKPVPKAALLSAIVFFLLSSRTLAAGPSGRFFFEGNGTVHLVNGHTGAGGPVTYRTAAGEYPQAAQRRINRVFDVPSDAPEGIALRLIALLDYLEDQLHGGPIKIDSGYRSPAYNEGLRRRGRLAARTSLHLEGMAADIEMQGVEGKRLWEFIRSLDCCGAGYYNSNEVHVDVGPSRFWDETSTGVDRDPGARNKLVLLRTQWDRYRPGEEVRMVLGRITDYPIGVGRPVRLLSGGQVVGGARLEGRTECILIPNRAAAKPLVWRIPPGIAPRERSRVRIAFCRRPSLQMPEGVESNPISIR